MCVYVCVCVCVCVSSMNKRVLLTALLSVVTVYVQQESDDDTDNLFIKNIKLAKC